MNSFELTVPDGRLNLDLCLRSGQVFRWRKEEDGSWVGVDGEHWYRFESVPVTQAEDLRLRVDTNGTETHAIKFFRLDRDAVESEKRILELGPELKPAVDSLKGIRLMRPSSITETVFTFLCTANNNLHRIIPMCWKLGSYGTIVNLHPPSPSSISDNTGRLAKAGSREMEKGGSLHAFPTVDRIAAIDDQELRQAGFGYRGTTIPKAARAIKERGSEAWLEGLREASYVEVHQELCSLPGIGPKLADCIALYGFDKGEAVPLDTHIWQAFTRLYHPEWKDKAVTDFRYRESTQRFRERFGELSGWAHLFLFYENLLNWRSRKRT